MELYLLRHGIAVELGTAGIKRDEDRTLTAEGTGKIKEGVRTMRRLKLSFDKIFSSPYPRALETARIVARGLDATKKVETIDALKPGGTLQEIIEILRPYHSQTILLVGHEPKLSGLISFLISGRPALSITMKKGGLAKLSVDVLEYGKCATLNWILTPRHLALMN